MLLSTTGFRACRSGCDACPPSWSHCPPRLAPKCESSRWLSSSALRTLSSCCNRCLSSRDRLFALDWPLASKLAKLSLDGVEDLGAILSKGRLLAGEDWRAIGVLAPDASGVWACRRGARGGFWSCEGFAAPLQLSPARSSIGAVHQSRRPRCCKSTSVLLNRLGMLAMAANQKLRYSVHNGSCHHWSGVGERG